MHKGSQLNNNITTYRFPEKEKESLLRRVGQYLANRDEIIFAYVHG